MVPGKTRKSDDQEAFFLEITVKILEVFSSDKVKKPRYS